MTVKHFRKILSIGLIILMFSSLTACGNNKNQQFYDTVYESQGLMDTVADAIYSNIEHFS